jgi:glycosyltransferase involved in cell wall biosynthesis
MYKDQSIAVVITAYNEAGFVGDVISTVPEFVDKIYAVDDGSTDSTWTEIREHAVATNGGQSTIPLSETDTAQRPVVVPIKHKANQGVGAAIKTGYRHALADGIDTIAVMNGDGQMDPAILDRIIDPVVEGRADYAKGNRLLSREHSRGMGAWRRFGNACLTVLTKIASGYWKTMDPQNGYTAISNQALSQLDLDSLYDDYGFLNDILVKLNAKSMRVADVEMTARYGEEKSTISYHRFIPSVSLLLLRGFLWRLKVRYLVYDFHPLVVLYLLGAVGSLSTLGQTAAYLGGTVSLWAFWTGSVLTLLVSGVTLSLAMTFDVMNNEHLERQELADDTPGRRHRDHPPVVQVRERSD